MVTEFRGDNYYLSNFFNAVVTYNGKTYKNNEAAFQAQKCPARSNEFVNLEPSAAKHLGRHVLLRKDWEQVKEEIMYNICVAKFTQHPELMDMLLKTDGLLQEGNYWHDTTWGVDLKTGQGQNKLGKILMYIREENRISEMEVCRLP